MKQFKRFGLPQNRIFISLPQEERLQVQEALLPEPVTQPDRWPSVRCLTPYRKSKKSLTLQVSRS